MVNFERHDAEVESGEEGAERDGEHYEAHHDDHKVL